MYILMELTNNRHALVRSGGAVPTWYCQRSVMSVCPTEAAQRAMIPTETTYVHPTNLARHHKSPDTLLCAWL